MIKTIRSSGLALACLALAALLAILVIARVTGCRTELLQVRRIMAAALAHSGKDPNEAKPSLAATRSVADTLKKKNLFVKEPPKEHPIKQVDGILGSEALIQNKWYKAGDKVGDARILSITATGVVAEWEGKKKTFSPITSAAPEAKRPEPNKAKVAEPNKPQKKPDANDVKAAAPGADDPFAFMGLNLPPGMREKLLAKWNELTDEQKQKAKEDWNKMSDEEKQQALKAMEEHM
jgi:hypothetical protein